MKKNNNLEILINSDSTLDTTLDKIAFFLSSNPNYKYSTTYIIDSDQDFETFKTNLIRLKSEMSKMYSYFIKKLSSITFELYSYNFDIIINNSLIIKSTELNKIGVVDGQDSELLAFINQKDYFDHHITIKFHYSLIQICDNIDRIDVNNNYLVEHTFRIKEKADIQSSFNEFTNLLKIKLCA